MKPLRSKLALLGLYNSINSSVPSLPVPVGLGSNSVTVGAIRPISLAGKCGVETVEVVAAKLWILAGGSVLGNNDSSELGVIGAAPKVVTKLQALVPGWTLNHEPLPGVITCGLLFVSTG